MKTEFQAKFLQHLTQKKQEQGFTLIELLVVIIIIGILSAIALPSFLNQANKAKQSEAKQNVGSMNRAQQAYYLENSTFGSTVENLGLGIQTQTTNYTYTVTAPETNGISTVATNRGNSLKAPLRQYAGRVELGTVIATSEATTLAILCETKAVAGNPIAANLTPTSTVVADGCTATGKVVDAK
ncbi:MULTISPECIES: type IV pilin-like G/H family protein [Trichocoleus]|uniref:Type IV pilin-like G/H family protein n=1 Tax=Trichocoleus desertorum GB2-A4 TaxID=2933944 RepID=A0ABV0JEU9_9CYAN|nr:type IV pilin-like G/H family protein [Trichocoleus sp. FACHB-46]MBD1861234.1 type IV pilin-like G/H family protein [Trichocoleus sp. FACHB-46]